MEAAKSKESQQILEQSKKLYLQQGKAKTQFLQIAKNRWAPLPQIINSKEYFNIVQQTVKKP